MEGCCGKRVVVTAPDGSVVKVPVEMTRDADYDGAQRDFNVWERLRCRHDFEFWAARCVTIRDKRTGAFVKLVLNRPQRRLVAVMEEQRHAGEPVRVILLKARQWGGSTVTQMYMAWMQTTRRHNWHSLVCAHVKDTAASIRGMYAEMLRNYPEELWDGDAAPGFAGFERTQNTRVIEGRGCRVTLGSSERQEAVRGLDFAMAHLSEVAFWSDSAMRSPEEFIGAICGSILREPDTLIVLESTANGVGNYFHSEWLRSCRGESDKRAVFVPWYEIDLYSTEVADMEKLWGSLTDYERRLWDRHGCTLEQIQWYRDKLREYGSAERMAAEYPSDDIEAFANTGSGVFSLDKIGELRRGCHEPLKLGELHGSSLRGIEAMEGINFVEDCNGKLKVWREPEAYCSGDRYVVAVDIGGRSARSDFSVISVLDRMGDSGVPEVVAQWRGHVDHDILAWKSATIGAWYGMALLVIESNTLETRGTEGDHSEFILSELSQVYPNMYHRVIYDRVAMSHDTRLGFHTNTSTKPMVIDRLIELVGSGGYVERDEGACDELAVYEVKPNGSFGAKEGYHDDILMTRAIGLYVISTTLYHRVSAGEYRVAVPQRWL
ncbi:MAG: hypothetical protein NC421_01040 [Lachnospiraceae bacterium]|nr:hypothetical protein [Lachnospiraceae bacterium]